MSKQLNPGTQTGSFMNFAMSGMIGMPEPEVGMGVTVLSWTDRRPATIVEVVKRKNGKVAAIVIQEDNAKRVDENGFSESQEYEYSQNPEAAKETFELRRNGAWAKAGDEAKNRLVIGRREKYHDFTF